MFAGYRWLRGDGTASATITRTNVYWLGSQYRAMPALLLMGAAYYKDNRSSSADP